MCATRPVHCPKHTNEQPRRPLPPWLQGARGAKMCVCTHAHANYRASWTGRISIGRWGSCIHRHTADSCSNQKTAPARAATPFVRVRVCVHACIQPIQPSKERQARSARLVWQRRVHVCGHAPCPDLCLAHDVAGHLIPAVVRVRVAVAFPRRPRLVGWVAGSVTPVACSRTCSNRKGKVTASQAAGVSTVARVNTA